MDDKTKKRAEDAKASLMEQLRQAQEEYARLGEAIPMLKGAIMMCNTLLKEEDMPDTVVVAPTTGEPTPAEAAS